MAEVDTLSVGDRIRTLEPMPGLPRNSRGVVQEIFPQAGVCVVRFDGRPVPRIVQARHLERTARVPI
jgi:hypothetical protein